MIKSRIWALVLPFALAIGTVPAFAQDEEMPEEGMEGGEEGGMEAGAEGGMEAGAEGGMEAGAEGGMEAGAEAGAEGGAEGAVTTDMGGEVEAGVYTKETWPMEYTKRPTTLAKGMIEIQGDIFINLSKEAVGKPFAIKPAIYYGVSDKLSVGLIHPGNGLCLAGEENGCAKVYNDVGLDAIFNFMTGNFNVGAHGGLVVTNFDPLLLGLNVGILGKLMSGKLSVLFDPKVRIGLTERDFNKEALSIPVQVAFQATPALAAFIETGINGPLDGFGDAFTVPVGLGALFALSNKLDVGLRFTLPIVAGGTIFEDVAGADFRTLDLLVNFRM